MASRGLNKRYVLMLRWGVPCALLTIALSVVAMRAAQRKDPAALNEDGSVEGLTSVLTRDADAEMVRFHFDEVAESAGITMRHFPDDRASLLPEDMGSGMAWGDYDNDGDPDLFAVNFKHSILRESAPIDPAPGQCRLFRNDGDGTFTDVSANAGLGVSLFGLGASWGDYDNDADLDLYVTVWGGNRLYRNEGNGRFIDVTETAAVGDSGFGAGCAWGDYDADGWIDLYVCNYVDFAYRETDSTRSTKQYGSEIPYTINPSSYRPQTNRLYRNQGDGTFVDVAASVGVDNPTGRSLGAVWFDFDSDGHLDLYVANDVSSNGVFRNMGDGTFGDIGASSLAADYRGAMGMAVGDYEHDGDLDLFVTHWVAQENAMFENMTSENWLDDNGERRLFFMDQGEVLGLGQISLRMVGWATGFADFDGDGELDLWVANGHTLEEISDPTKMKPQLTQLFRMVPEKGYYEIGEAACPALAEPFVGRGGAHADYDGDGRMDLVLMAHGGSPRLLHNTTEGSPRMLQLRLRQATANRFALGAMYSVVAGERTYSGQIGADGGYLSQHELDPLIGLGTFDGPVTVVVRWPDGAEQTVSDFTGDDLELIHEDDYRAVPNQVRGTDKDDHDAGAS